MFQKSLLSLFVISSLFGESTMCYKENFATPSKLENSPLDGGSCNSQYSIKDMKNMGWNIKDISTSKGENGVNYTYVFSKENITIAPVTQVPKDENILKSQLALIESERIAKEKVDLEAKKLANGKKIYETQCVRCHGSNGELKPNSSQKLLGMNSEDFMDALREYGLNQRNSSSSILMTPYSLITFERREVVKYLESINVLKKPIENKESK